MAQLKAHQALLNQIRSLSPMRVAQTEELELYPAKKKAKTEGEGPASREAKVASPLISLTCCITQVFSIKVCVVKTLDPAVCLCPELGGTEVPFNLEHLASIPSCLNVLRRCQHDGLSSVYRTAFLFVTHVNTCDTMIIALTHPRTRH